MTRPWVRRVAGAWTAGFVSLCLLPQGGARPTGEGESGPVFPPGQEDLLRRMLDPAGSRCQLVGIAVHRDTVRGTYRCPEGEREARLLPADPDGGSAPFTLTLTPEHPVLRGVLETSVRRFWDQVVLERPQARSPEPPPPPGIEAPPPEFSPEEQRQYDRAEALVKEGRCPEALLLLSEMARQRPISQTLGLMVVCLASDALDPARLAQEIREAEAHPEDPLAAFRAGVISHYAGHRLAATREEKAAFYRDAVRFLLRARPALREVTRVHLYLAVSLYRLGDQQGAEEAIEQAVALAERTRDADAWYCRAEIRHRKDLDGALQDIATYFQVMDANIAQGAIHAPGKQRRVRQMQARLQRALEGQEPLRPDEDLFDPLPNPVIRWIQRPLTLIVAGILLAVAASGLLLLRIRRR